MAAPIRLSQQHSCSFDHLVGARKHRWWYVEAKRLGGLEVNHQLVLGRRLHRQIGGLLALEDAIDVPGRASVWVDRIGPVGDQAAIYGVKAERVDPRQTGCG